MPWTVANPPNVAKNWTAGEKRKCVAAANAVLDDGGTEEEAIFACIRAAGHSSKDLPAGRSDVATKQGKRGTKEISLEQRISAVRRAFYDQFPDPDQGPYSYVLDVFEGHLIVERGMELLRIPYMTNADGSITFGEPVRVEIQFVPVEKSALTVFKQADGRYRWVGLVSNHYRDNDTPAEIISAKAHQRFVAKVYDSGKFPELWIWHVPGSRIGVADMVDFADGFLIESGLFDDDAVGEVFAKSQEPMTMSHGFIRLEFDPVAVVTEDYDQIEVSVLPAGAEANPFTQFTVTQEVGTMLSKAQREFLVSKIGEERVQAIEANTKSLAEVAKAAGIDYKALQNAGKKDDAAPADDGADSGTHDGATTTPATAGAGAAVDPSALVAQIVAAVVPQVMQQLDVKSLSDTIAELQTKASKVDELAAAVNQLTESVRALKQDDDAKLAQLLTPKAAEGFSWSRKAASKSEETKLDPQDRRDQGLKDREPALAGFMAAIAEAAGVAVD